ncbi:VOC family protein [Evansella tamaricis]|uniref:VOC family protein n=1 Tax=Evansella tamaricis TaxID=2069301 RepID=A0ABS6JEN2_9BACI|nr:VOC family protein [Evansella tamaricis]MBU9712046.1 VOC family protein [Evansella tamaricis]
MKIGHMALWTRDLEIMKDFYVNYFNGKTNGKYHNKVKGFESYFIRFEGETRLELMRQEGMSRQDIANRVGWAHIAMSLGSREHVNQMTERLQQDGYRLMDGPRKTGDGYYESVFQDPEGNLLELTE